MPKTVLFKNVSCWTLFSLTYFCYRYKQTTANIIYFCKQNNQAQNNCNQSINYNQLWSELLKKLGFLYMDQVIGIKKAFHTFTILHLKLFSIRIFPTKKKRGWDFSARWDFDWVFMKKKCFFRRNMLMGGK